jgi:membrane protease YdiL (CAAX protease family)
MIPSSLSHETCAKAAPFVPHNQISARTGLWSFLLGVGLVGPLVLSIASLHLPQSAATVAASQRQFLYYVLHPGILFLRAVVIYPVLEEIFYRGLILQLLRRYCPLWFAILVSTAFFAVTHLGGGYGTAINAFLLGSFFAWLTVRTRSLFPSIICHAAFNFSWRFLIGPAFGITEKMLNPPLPFGAVYPLHEIFPLWWIAVSLGLVIAGLVMFTKAAPRTSAVA